MSIKSACLACIAIAIFYIIAIVSYDDDDSVVGQRQQDTFSSGNNLRQLSLIDPKTVETRQGSGLRSSSGVSFNDQLEQVSRDFLSAHTFITIINVLHLCHLFVTHALSSILFFIDVYDNRYCQALM